MKDEQALPVRDTDVPESADMAVRPLLGSVEADRLASVSHALIEELAGLSVRVAALEARLDGRDADLTDIKAIQADAARLIARVLP